MTVDLETTYLGMRLRNPLVVSASPLGRDVDRLLQFEQAGAAAVVLPSLFEEQIEEDSIRLHSALEYGAESFPEALSFLPELVDYNTGPERYMALLEDAVARLSIPVIPSLNGSSPGGWTRHAGALEESGASAIELNIYFVAADMSETSAQVEKRYLSIVEDVRRATALPIAVKVGPYFSAMANMARRLVDAGADGLVLFNRFYQPDIDLDELEVVPNLNLSSSVEMRLPLRWIAILHGRLGNASLAATTGVHDEFDAMKLLLAGADVTMMASALLRHGPDRVSSMVEGISRWMAEREYRSVDQLKGSMSWRGAPNPSALERSNYVEVLASYTVPT
jgi:dihydroorotate dehydrogenase (fumarate)